MRQACGGFLSIALDADPRVKTNEHEALHWRFTHAAIRRTKRPGQGWRLAGGVMPFNRRYTTNCP
jgi:hypothetical protein